MLRFLTCEQTRTLLEQSQRGDIEATVLLLCLSGMGFVTANEKDVILRCQSSIKVAWYAASLSTAPIYADFAKAAVAWGAKPDEERGAFIELCLPFRETLPSIKRLCDEYFSQQQRYPVPMSEIERVYRMAADSGHAASQYLLAIHLSAGDGVVQNESDAFAYLERAVEQSYPDALDQLALCYAKKGQQAEFIKYLRQLAAEKDIVDVQYHLARRYHASMSKTAKNKDELWQYAMYYYSLAIQTMFLHGEPQQDKRINLLKVLDRVHTCMREYGTSLFKVGMDENEVQQPREAQHGETLLLQDVDLDKYPEIGKADPNTEYVIPDLHGSLEKLLFILQSLGIMQMSKEEFLELSKIIGKTTWYSTAKVAQDLPCFFTIQDKERFREIVTNIKFGSFPPGARVIFLGDILMDRGGAPQGQAYVTHSNDFLMLLVFQWLHTKLGIDKFRILFSNHDLEFFCSLHAGSTKFYASDGECFSTFMALSRLMQSKIITREELDGPLEDYIQHLDLLNHAPCQLGTDAPAPMIYSHAPMGLEIIKLLCREELSKETCARLDADEWAPAIVTCQRVDAINETFRRGLLATSGTTATKAAHALRYVAKKFNPGQINYDLGSIPLVLNFFGNGKLPAVLLPVSNRDTGHGAGSLDAIHGGVRFCNGHTKSEQRDTSLDGVGNSVGRWPTGLLRVMQLPRPSLELQQQPPPTLQVTKIARAGMFSEHLRVVTKTDGAEQAQHIHPVKVS